MARERMITRTVNRTVCTVMGLDISTAEVKSIEVTLGGTYEKDTDLLKACKKVCETDTFKAVAITDTKTEEVLYGMPEIDFIKFAKVLPPRSVNTAE